MKTQLVITDLTRMNRGAVCIAGYDKHHTCVRPILPPPGILEKSLFLYGKAIIFPFSLVELDLLDPKPQPPHTEDQYFDPYSLSYVRDVKDRETVLKWSLFDSVTAIFEQPILTKPGHYVLDCQGPRSLGTVLPKRIIKAKYEAGVEDNWDYRLEFIDQNNETYSLKITDLTWQYFCSNMLSEERDQSKIAAELTKLIHERKVYLRIGLARGWKKYPERCYLQITGIYTFPDYLDGKIFSDFLNK